MGLGKTIQVLAYLLHLKETRAAEGVHLLICPTSLVANWRTEIQRFAPELRVYVHHGAHRHVPAADGRSPLEVARENCDVVLTTYATVVRDAELLQALAWDAVIADEAQNIKNPETKQARAVHGLHAIHRIALTGTPMENRLEELWSIVQFVNPGYLGSLTWFRQTFAIPIAQREQAAARRLQRLLHPLLLRRSKSDPAIQLELPEKWEFTQYAALTAEQAALYQSVVDQLFTGLPHGRSMSRRGQILASLVRLKQVCDHPCLLQGEGRQRNNRESCGCCSICWKRCWRKGKRHWCSPNFGKWAGFCATRWRSGLAGGRSFCTAVSGPWNEGRWWIAFSVPKIRHRCSCCR
ncbi:hypothetical protein GCM10025857_08590 [Alicyclobacillus contaminans]|nr:hypothetical protein GCM10025857_08590 [Alicyclobacillus contaminans]